MTDALPKPPENFRVLIVYPNLPLMLVPSIAIALFTRLLKNQGYRVDLFETTHYDTDETNYSETRINYSENRTRILNARKFNIKEDLGINVKSGMLRDFRRKVEEFAPDFMIFSVVEDTFLQTLSMLERIKDLHIPHLVGGVFPTMAPECCMREPLVRMIGLGEGEGSVPATAEAVRQGRPLDSIPGTWYRRDDGSIAKLPQPPLVDIDGVIPDFSLFDESRFYRPMGGRVFKMVPVESYRGCPYSCTYCNSPAQRILAKDTGLGNFLRRKIISDLRNELAELREAYNPDFFFFVDDSFLARPRQEIFAFCDMYEEFRLPFYFNTRAENCDTEILQRLKDVGCYRIAFGIEAGNEQYRRRVLSRKISNQEIIRRFKLVADSGIAFSLNLIIGMPGETRELVMDTVELVRSIHGYDALTSFIFTPYRGTQLRKVAVENGWLDPETITRHNTSRSLLEMPPPCLNADEIDGLLATLPLYCYFPKDEWENIRRAEQNDEEGLRIREQFADIYHRNFFKETQDMPKTYLRNPLESGGAVPGRTERLDVLRLKALTDPLARSL